MIQVTADGYVHVGNNEWVSLDKVQQAVLNTQNPGLTANCPEGEHRERNVTSNEEYLPLPSTSQTKFKPRQEQAKQTINAQVEESDEHLIMPSSHRQQK